MLADPKALKNTGLWNAVRSILTWVQIQTTSHLAIAFSHQSGDNLLHRHLAMTATASCLYPHPIKLPRACLNCLIRVKKLCAGVPRGFPEVRHRAWNRVTLPSVWAAIEDLSYSLISYVTSIGADVFGRGRPDGLHRPLRRFACSSQTRRMFTAPSSLGWELLTGSITILSCYDVEVCSAMLLG
jgi:hypothetical protein